jgi:stage II sporulation protein D
MRYHGMISIDRALAGLALILACAGCRVPAAGSDRAASPRDSPAVAAAGLTPLRQAGAATVAPASAAYALVDLSSGDVGESQHVARLSDPLLPGSIMKIVTLQAALASGVVSTSTRLACPRRVRHGERVLDCSHPDFPAGLGPAEALAHSCNAFFVAIAPRVGREALSRAARSIGLPAVPPDADLVLAALGLDGSRVSALMLLRAVGRAVQAGGYGARDASRGLIAAGLRDCALGGTASALGRAHIDALAKTATTEAPGGGVLGVVVVLSPSRLPRRGVVVLAPGAAGRDAAEIAAALLARDRPAARTAVGRLRVGRAQVGGYSVVELPLESYVAEVVSAEAPPGAAPALLEALAIVARSYALAGRGRHAAEGFDVCDLTHCQAARPTTRGARSAAEATAGEVVSWRAQPAQVFYTASCGGRLESPAAVWSSRRPSFGPAQAARPDPVGHPEEEWTTAVEERHLLAALRAAGVRGQAVGDLRIVARTASGRASLVAIDGMRPDRLDGETFRLAVGRHLGWQVLKSSLFDVERVAAGYRFRGRGRGHGVGLCVAGAMTLAARGRTAVEILRTYFPDATLVQFTALGQDVTGTAGAGRVVRLVLPTADESRRAGLLALMREAVARLEADTGEAWPPDVTIRFHPTGASYQRETGQAWWTLGATADRRIDLAPLATIESRGSVEATLRHELAHVLTAPALVRAPIWVREGAALHFSRQRLSPRPGGAASSSASCPDDASFRRSGSPGALAAAYSAALQCFEGALEAGADWRTIH